MSISERYLGFAVPPIISSSQFTLEHLTFRPIGSKRDYQQGDQFTISFSNLNKAQFIVPDHTYLTFDVIVQVDSAATGNTEASGGMFNTIDTVPLPKFGCSYFESCTASVPGSTDFSAMPSSASDAAAYWYSTRLLASSCGHEGAFDRAATFRLPGRYGMAGGQSGLQRLHAVNGVRAYTKLGSGTTGGGGTEATMSVRGGTLSCCYPASSFISCFSKASSLIPLGYVSQGGEALVVNWVIKRSVEDILGPLRVKSGFSNPRVTLIDPRIITAVVRVQNPVSIAQLSSLYDGRLKMALPGPTPESPPLELAVPMVTAFKRFNFAQALVPFQGTPGVPPALNTSTPWSLTFSGVNEPSVSAIVLRFRYRPDGSDESLTRRSRATMYLGADEPTIVMRNVSAQIGTDIIPLRGVTGEGATTVPAYLAADGPPGPPAANAPADGTYICAATEAGLQAQLFELGRHGLGLWCEEDHGTSLADVVFDKTSLNYNLRVALPKVTGPLPTPAWPADGPIALLGCDLEQKAAAARIEGLANLAPGYQPSGDVRPIALLVIPLNTFPQLVGDFSNAHTCRSWDLRSVSSFTVSGSMQEIATASQSARKSTYISGITADVIIDGALVCDGMLRLAAGSSDSRYISTAVANSTTSP